MSRPEISILGMGLPIIDRIGSVQIMPTSREKSELQIVAKDLTPKHGGVIPNILSNYVALSSDTKQIHLLAAVGDDHAGSVYTRRLDQRIQNIEVIRSQETAQLYDLLTPDGNRIWELFLGAAGYVSANPSHYRAVERANSYFMVDINTIREPTIMNEARKTLEIARANLANTIINLSGIQGIDETRIRKISQILPQSPLAVFGNDEEFDVIDQSVLKNTVNNARLLVHTMGEEGSIMKFDGVTNHIQSVKVPDSEFRSSVGCGDSFMGSFLALCLAEKSDFWSARLLEQCANFGSFIASETAKSYDSRLNSSDLSRLKRIYFKKHKIGDI